MPRTKSYTEEKLQETVEKVMAGEISQKKTPKCCSPGSPHEDVDANPIELLHKSITYLETQLKIEKDRSEMQKKECDHVHGVLRTTMVKLNKEREKMRFSIEEFKNSDRDVCYYTGFPTYKTLQECFRLLNPVSNVFMSWQEKNSEAKINIILGSVFS
ncbi:hypothetical protein LSH36_854g00000 [Paralvinella palmiformis]|uniref:Uncharacterized protein n=1 Tax=Paralvinella palmiformis TaxID=53620 RepID=A0AAD9J0D8_9ANNE|nr:hypothetical protein LSH36_854g00000 [Paralvinella palmiformis]